MSNTILLISFISLSAVFTVIADVLGKQWIATNKIIYFIIALILILFSGAFFLVSLKYNKLGIVSVTWDAVTSIILIIIGYYLYKEGLTIEQIIAVGVILLAEFVLLKG